MLAWLFRKLDSGNHIYENDADIENRRLKNFADDYAESYQKMMKETDPLKKDKMANRLALGITDFSDL